MQLLIIILLLGTNLSLSRSRPSRLVEENDSETAEADYEGDDDTAADDYLREDQEPLEEAQQKTGRRDALQEAQEQQGDSRRFEPASDQQAQDKYGYDTFSEINSGTRNGRERNRMTDLNNENEKNYLPEKGSSARNYQQDEASNIAPDEINSRSSVNLIKRPQSDMPINGRYVNTNPEYGEMLFKIKPDQTNRQQNNLVEEADEESSLMKQSGNNMHSKNRNQEIEKTLNYGRDRRNAQNVEDKHISDSTRVPNDKQELDITNESSENAIIKNIKKLSEEDLEELLNSLPEDKKALLKKIMDKREITKKAGAVDESSDSEGGQVDTSKLRGDPEDRNTKSAITSDTTETTKQKENEDSSKSPDVESGSRGSESKSELVANLNMKNDNLAIEKENESYNSGSKDDVNLNSEAEAEEISKNENKREINSLSNKKMLSEDTNVSDYQLEAKDSNGYLVNQEDVCSENEDWSDTLQSEPKENDAHIETKREIDQNNPSALPDCVKSLEDSFPAINYYEDNHLDSDMAHMAPLKRVKRTGKNHYIKKRDSPHFSNIKVQFSPVAESENYENEKNEFEEYGAVDHVSNLRNDQQIRKVGKMSASSSGSPKRLPSHINTMYLELNPAILSESQKKDKSLSSVIDGVVSGVKRVDDNIMYNSGLRGKRTSESSNGNDIKMSLKRSGRTAGPLNVNVVSDNSINVSQYQDEAFGPLVRNSEEDVSRFKRVRQIKQDVHT